MIIQIASAKAGAIFFAYIVCVIEIYKLYCKFRFVNNALKSHKTQNFIVTKLKRLRVSRKKVTNINVKLQTFLKFNKESRKTLDFTVFLGYSRRKVEESGRKSHISGAKWWIS